MDQARQTPASRTPLYDERYEHDACGVGFVADAGGRSRSRVLGLALQGLSSLGHRGAFAADGESSDGAGISFPLDPSVLAALAGPVVAERRPGIAMLFLPRGRAAERAARALVATVLAEAGLTLVAWRAVPFQPSALGAAAAASRPTPVQAIIERPTRAADDSAARDRRRLRAPAGRRPAPPGAGRAHAPVAPSPSCPCPSMSCLTVVYKGLVAGGRLADLYPDLRLPLDVGYAVFHQRYATNTRPVWRLAQPFRHLAHNGEINTVRGNREQVRGRTRDLGAKAIAAELIAAGPLLSPDGSDSLSLDEGLELLTTTGWDLTPAILAAIPEALPLRRAPHPHVATLRRRTAGMLAPWDGPAAIVFADGRRVGGAHRPQRAAAGGLRRDPRPARGRSRRRPAPCPSRPPRPSAAAGSGRASCCSSSRAAGPSWRTPTPRPGRCARCPSTTRRGPSTRTRPRRPPRPARSARPGTPLRYLVGLDAERARLDIKTMALEAHEPLWSMGDDTPTAGRGRLDRPGRRPPPAGLRPGHQPGHRSRSASASSWTCGSSSGGGRRCSAGRRAGRARCASHRPIVADLDGLLDALRAGGRRTTDAGCHVAGVGRRGRPGRRPRRRWPRPRWPPRNVVWRSSSSAMRPCRSIACPCRPSWPPAPSTPP